MRKRSVVPGLVLIIIGVLVLLSNLNIGWPSMEELWPLVLILLGVLALVTTFTGQSRDRSGVWFGVVGILAGVVFLYITMGKGEWEDMKTLWPIFPAIGGLGWIVQWIFERQAMLDLSLGIGALAVALVGYLVIQDKVTPKIADFWPLILVLMGVGLIAQFLVQRKKS